MSFRKITVKSGNEESTLEVTEEEYRNYFRPWWQQKKHEQRNREAMEQNGYTEESYEAWRDNASEEVGIPDMELPGVDELVELRAEKAYFGNESEPEKLFEGDGVMHPYTLVVTQGETVWELPLGWEDNGFPPLNPIYWDEERTGRGWTQDRAGRPVLVLWFDSFSRMLDIYALGLQGGKPVLLPVPEGEFQAEPDHWSEWYT